MKHPHLFAACLCVITAPSASAQTSFSLDFDKDDQGAALLAGSVDLAANEPYRNLFAPGIGVRLSTNKPSGKPLNLYYTEGTGGADDDLERNSTGTGLWAGGSDLGLIVNNVLMINTDSNLSNPNDSAGGGDMILNFDIGLVGFGFDFIDLDTPDNGSVTFLDVPSGTSRTVAFADFEDGAGSPFARSGVHFGNRHANRILDISALDLGMERIDRVTFTLLSSGGIGTVYGTTAAPVPQANSSAMILGSMALLSCFRRR